MTRNRFLSHCLVCAFILLVGLGLALTIPLSASFFGLAAHNRVGATGKAPTITRYYVAKTGDGTNPTLGWSTAFTNVQDALALAAVFGGEIWVAAGVYYPDQGIGQIDDSRNSTFVLAENVQLYGGFDSNDSTFSERDWEKNLTVLSGDVDGDDTSDSNGVVVYTGNINGVNATHVVSARNVSGTAVLDGFTITAGYAHDNNSVGGRLGGGLYCNASGSGSICNPTLTNVIFSGNSANSGGAMFNSGSGGDSSPKLTNVIFVGNSADHNGGGMHNAGYSKGRSSPNLKNVVFSGNSAKKRGGAMYNDGSFLGESSPSLTNVTFSDNSAVLYGGAMYNDGNSDGNSSPSLINVIFSGNSADLDGGGIYNHGAQGENNPSLTNVVFSGNSAVYRGGAMYSDGSESGDTSPRLTNVTFSGNFAGEIGGGMYNYGYNGNCKPVVQNSIFWNNQDNSGTEPLFGNIYNNAANVTVIHTIIQGSEGSSSWTGGSYVDGGANIDVDPKFITPINPSTAPTTNGNLRLKSNSPAIDKGDNSHVTGVPTDLDGEPRIVDGDINGTPTVDMGAYEYQIEEVYMPLIFR